MYTLKAECQQNTGHSLAGHLDFGTEKWSEDLILILVLLALEQGGEGIAETLKEYEVKVQQLEKDFFYSRENQQRAEEEIEGLFWRVTPSTNGTY